MELKMFVVRPTHEPSPKSLDPDDVVSVEWSGVPFPPHIKLRQHNPRDASGLHVYGDAEELRRELAQVRLHNHAVRERAVVGRTSYTRDELYQMRSSLMHSGLRPEEIEMRLQTCILARIEPGEV